MRSRTNSGVRLDYYQRLIYKTIMKYQDPVTGLFPASPTNRHAWIRDNVYSILSIWGLSMAYKKNADMDEDRAKTYELEQSCVKMMRGLLMAMMRQTDKLELFKGSQCPLDAIHAKYSSETGQVVVGDSDWGHLQIDAVSLYLLVLAQMTASGLQIVFNLDEVSFIQNLVFYIESAYCIPDYGIWERGDKSNHGLPELNASSIGMAKAALEAMNELDLFGARGGPSSVIHVLADEAQKCEAVLQSMLPRESNSKEVDSSLLSVISFPAFAVDDPEIIQVTKETIIGKLSGHYGLKRFLRDGYKTPKEDPSRLYYEPWELRMFENIECEWPLFFCYIIIDAAFRGDQETLLQYSAALDKILIKTEDGLRLVPELFAVTADGVPAEYKCPGSQARVPLGRCPFMWAQSLYILGKLLQEGFLAAGELDPLNRRLGSEKKPDVVVQVVILAEDAEIQEKLRLFDIHVETIAEVGPIQVQPARVLSHLYAYLGWNKKLGLSGRKCRDVGILCTSKLYALHDKIFAFTPQSLDLEENYLIHDPPILAHNLVNDLAFLSREWKNSIGRPTFNFLVSDSQCTDDGKIPISIITTIKKLKSGYTVGTRVTLGFLKDFLSTSCLTNLSFLGSVEEGIPENLHPSVEAYLEDRLGKAVKPSIRKVSGSGLKVKPAAKGVNRGPKRLLLKGTIKRTRSIYKEDRVGWKEEKRGTLPLQSPSRLVSDEDSRSPSPPPLVGIKSSPTMTWKPLSRIESDLYYEKTEVDELIGILRETDSLEEQGDILHYLVCRHGLDYCTGLDEHGISVTVKDLLKNLYDKACGQKLWGLVRHSAGMLGKRVEDLAKAVTDLIVRQKQVTVGMPPKEEVTITGPLPENELRLIIHQTYGDDESTAMLTQELLVYLAMFIRTEPHLFMEMLRLRVGLIIQVMASELGRTLNCSGEDASEHLLNLSPFEMKNILYHIMSGKEFGLTTLKSGLHLSHSVTSTKSSRMKHLLEKDLSVAGHPPDEEESESEKEQGQWLRRRRLDGALNRVPRNFYPRVWSVLERCFGLEINATILPNTLTQEMTSGELKFALRVESVLNRIPEPEYRQLCVEALMVLSLLVEHNICPSLGHILQVEDLVHTANSIFLKEQAQMNGDASLCCAKENAGSGNGLLCGGSAGVCQHFYDSAPSGSYGTMTYMTRALAQTISFPREGQVDCTIT